MKVHLLYPDQDFDAAQKLPFNAEALAQDLELNTMFEAMARDDEYLLDVVKHAIFSSLESPDLIRYRQEILRDCLKNPAVIREIYNIPLEAIERKHKGWLGIYTRYPSSILNTSVQLLEMFMILLKKMRQLTDEHIEEFESQGFQRFFRMIQQELNDDYFKEIQEHLNILKFQHGVLISAELGNGNEGTNFILRRNNRDDRPWVKRVLSPKSPVYSFSLHPRDEAGARALGDLRDRGVNLVANAVAQSADHIDSFLNVLRFELAFYIGSLNLSEELAKLGEPIAFPLPLPVNERRHSFTGLYDVSLALTMKKKIVGNEVNADGKSLVMITGANQGGKSTFLRSIGQAQRMMQCGMFVGAESFSANVSSGLFTHYKRGEDSTMTSGKFDEELGRMSAIIDHIKPNSMVLFNESFAATNEREGSEIARQIVTALLEKQVKIFFVTHLYELAHSFHVNGHQNTIFLRADRQENGQRTYKLIRAEPLETSFGIDAYRKIFGGEHEKHIG